MHRIDAAFRQCDDRNAMKGEDLVDCRGIRLVPRDPVKRFSNDHIETAVLSGADEFLNRRPCNHSAAGQRSVCKKPGFDPALLADELPADRDLILNRTGGLEI
nr:hypothetical protein [Hyphomonas polymorpha]